MLKHILKATVLTRIEKITSLYNEICIDDPIRIDINKIKQPIQLINLAWILAFCRRGFESFCNVNFNDLAVAAMAESIRVQLTDTLQYSGRLNNLNAKYYDEPDFVSYDTYKKKLSYEIPPSVVISLLSEDPIFNKYLLLKSSDIDPENNLTIPVSEELIRKNGIISNSKPMKRKKPLKRRKLEEFVEFLINDSPFDTYQKFKDAMINEYGYKNGHKPENQDTYDDHDEVKRVYCVLSKKEETPKNLKYLVHFSFINQEGRLLSQNPYSLSSFKKIFEEVRARLNSKSLNSTNPTKGN